MNAWPRHAGFYEQSLIVLAVINMTSLILENKPQSHCQIILLTRQICSRSDGMHFEPGRHRQSNEAIKTPRTEDQAAAAWYRNTIQRATLNKSDPFL